jgi:hypothetical protein
MPVVDKRLIRHRFWGNFGSLLFFNTVVTFAFFQDFGKWESWWKWVNKCVICTSGHLAWCLRHLFGLLLSPQAFLNFSIFTNVHMSQGLMFSSWVSSTDVSRAWTLDSTHCSWFASHRSLDVNCLLCSPCQGYIGSTPIVWVAVAFQSWQLKTSCEMVESWQWCEQDIV